MAKERPSWAPTGPQLRRLLVVIALLAECCTWASASEEDTEGHGLFTDSEGAQQQPQPSLDVVEGTEEAFKIATAKLHMLLDLLDDGRELERRQRDLVEAIHDGLNPPKVQSATAHTAAASVEQLPSEQLKKKTMKLQQGFTETAAATLLGRRPDDEDVSLADAKLKAFP